MLQELNRNRTKLHDMPFSFNNALLHDFPDRSVREMLSDPQNLRDLLMEVIPDISSRLDFDRVEPVERTFLLDDWRRRESDLLFRIPLFPSENGQGGEFILVCVMIEHQSTADPLMPLRMLLYNVLFWEDEWKEWAKEHEYGEPLRLTPVIPIVFHTGSNAWRAYRELSELVHAPEELQTFIPRWRILFWDLADQSPESLVERAGAWMRALAIVRAEKEDTTEFRTIFERVMLRLSELEGQEVRRHDLLAFVLSWVFLRRPTSDREWLQEMMETGQFEAGLRREFQEMAEIIPGTWQAEILAQIDQAFLDGEQRGRAEGEQRGRVEGEQRGRAEGEQRGRAEGVVEGALEATRELIRLTLEERLGPLPQELWDAIRGIGDLARLKAAARQAVHVESFDEFHI